MVKVTQTLQDVSAPNYMGLSKEPSRRDVFAAQDQSLATLFNGLGKTLDAGVKGGVQAIQTNIQQDFMKSMNPLMDEMGANTQPDQVPAIAGTGARGAHYTAAVQAGMANPDQFADTASVPPALANQTDSLKKLKAAYAAGHLSQTYFDTRVGAILSNLKSQYPGFEDYVDTVGSSMHGVAFANQIRKSLLTDMMSMQAANNSTVSKLQARYHEDGKYLDIVKPGLTQQEYMANPSAYDVEVNHLKARDQLLQSDKLKLEHDAAVGQANSDTAVRVYTEQGNALVSDKFRATLNALNIRAQDLRTAAAAGNADPKAIAQFQADLENTTQQVKLSLSGIANSPLKEGSTFTTNSIVKDKAKIDAANEQILLPFKVVGNAVAAKDWSAATAAGQMSKQTTELDVMHLMDKNKQFRVMKAVGAGLGNQTLSTVFQMTGGKGLDQLAETYLKAEFVNTNSTEDGDAHPPTTISTEISAATKANNGKQPGKVAMISLGNHVTGIMNNQDVESAARHAQAIFGDQKFFAALSPSDQRKAYTMLTSNAMSARMLEVGKSNPQALQMYSDWVEGNAAPLYKQAVDDLQGAQSSKAMNVQFDPKSLHFTQTTNPEYQNKDFMGNPLYGGANGVTDTTGQLNALADRIKPVLDARYGEQAPQAFMRILTRAGYNPNAPKQDSFMNRLGAAVESGVNSLVDKVKGGPLLPVGSSLSGSRSEAITLDESKTSSDDTPLHAVLRQGESSNNYDSLFGEKSRSLNLTQHTIGEVMALQQHQIETGAKSSAAGAYQFLRGTLASLIKEGVVKPTDQFDQATQDKMATALMERRGLADFQAGKITKAEFLNSLAKEWAGLPTTSGLSYYEGDGLNHATVRLPQVFAALDKVAVNP